MCFVGLDTLHEKNPALYVTRGLAWALSGQFFVFSLLLSTRDKNYEVPWLESLNPEVNSIVTIVMMDISNVASYEKKYLYIY